MMNAKEALDDMCQDCNSYPCYALRNGDMCYQRKLVECELEKRTPKKPKISGVTTKDGVFHPINGIDCVPYELCPSCETNLCTTGILAQKRMRYCEHCGQAIDWSE